MTDSIMKKLPIKFTLPHDLRHLKRFNNIDLISARLDVDEKRKIYKKAKGQRDNALKHKKNTSWIEYPYVSRSSNKELDIMLEHYKEKTEPLHKEVKLLTEKYLQIMNDEISLSPYSLQRIILLRNNNRVL